MRAGLNVRLDHLDQQIEAVLLAVQALPEGAQAASRSPGAWSPLQTVQHLVLVHEGAAAILGRTPAHVSGTHHPSWWRPAAMRFVLRAGIRIRAPTARVIPVETVPVGRLTERWRDAQARLRGEIEAKAARWADDGVFRHPLAGWLDARQTLDFLADHIEHHRSRL